MEEMLQGGEERCLPRGSACVGTTEAAGLAAVPRLILTFPACFLLASRPGGRVCVLFPSPSPTGRSLIVKAMEGRHPPCTRPWQLNTHCAGVAAGMVAPACAPPQARTPELRDADTQGAADGQLISRGLSSAPASCSPTGLTCGTFCVQAPRGPGRKTGGWALAGGSQPSRAVHLSCSRW